MPGWLGARSCFGLEPGDACTVLCAWCCVLSTLALFLFEPKERSVCLLGGAEHPCGVCREHPWCRGAAPKLSVLPQNAHGSARGAAWPGRSARCCREQAACRLPGSDLRW